MTVTDITSVLATITFLPRLGTWFGILGIPGGIMGLSGPAINQIIEVIKAFVKQIGVPITTTSGL